MSAQTMSRLHEYMNVDRNLPLENLPNRIANACPTAELEKEIDTQLLEHDLEMHPWTPRYF
tara:strand:+ start:219 stop:401 length:183 start_codon:yes stop_codon:yes gene_type:complete